MPRIQCVHIYSEYNDEMLLASFWEREKEFVHKHKWYTRLHGSTVTTKSVTHNSLQDANPSVCFLIRVLRVNEFVNLNVEWYRWQWFFNPNIFFTRLDILFITSELTKGFDALFEIRLNYFSFEFCSTKWLNC